MPLDKSKTKAAFKSNVREMIKAGHPRDQSLAAAYRIQRGKKRGGRAYADGGEVDDQLLPPPQNPLAPPDAVQRGVGNALSGIGNIIATPRRAMDQGITTEEAIPWGANTAMAMTGASSPFAAMRGAEKNALGVGAVPKVSVDIPALAEKLSSSRGNRDVFDPLLAGLPSLNNAQLKTVYETVTGSKSYAKTKDEIIASLKRHQRQWELNSDRSKAQYKDFQLARGGNVGGYAEGGEVDPWAQGVRAAETGAIAPSPYRNADMDAMINIGRAGDTIKKNAPLLMDTGPGRVAQAVGRFASGSSPYAGPGLRREDYTDDPTARQPVEPMVNDAMNVADVMSMGSLPSVGMRGAERGALGVGVPPKINSEVPTIAKQLTEALHSTNPQDFHALHRSLRESLSAADAKSLAKEFTGISASSKEDAMKKIMKRLENLEVFRKKSAATAGRSAFAEGGSVPFFARQGASQLAHSGMIHSTVPGRTDRLPMGVKRNSFVLPADTVSSIGEGNSQAGAAQLDRMFKSGPYGSAMPHIQSAKAIRQKFAQGGDVGEPVDIVAAGGEYVLSPDQVAKVGGGDLEHGHNVLDAFVKHIRKHTVKTLRKLKGPKAS